MLPLRPALPVRRHGVAGQGKARALGQQVHKVAGGRLEFQLMSAGMAKKWVETAKGFYDRIKELGPNPLRKGGK